MKGTASDKRAQKLSNQAEQASAALAVAEKAVKSAAEKSKQAKRQRKLAKKAVQVARKELKQAKKRRAEARRALAAATTTTNKAPAAGAKKSVKAPAPGKSVREGKKVKASPAKRKSKPAAKRRKPRAAAGPDAGPVSAVVSLTALAPDPAEETPPAPLAPVPPQHDIMEGKEVAPQTTME